MHGTQSDQQALLEKARKSCAIIRESVEKYGMNAIAIVWSGDFESILLLHLVKEEFGNIPLSIVHFDDSVRYTPFHMVRDNIVKTWDLDLKVELMEAEDDAEQKNQVSLDVMDHCGWQALLIPTINTESSGLTNAGFFRPDDPNHIAVYPLLSFTATDVQTCMDLFGLQESGIDDAVSNNHDDTGKGNSRSDESDNEAKVTQRLRDLGYL